MARAMAITSVAGLLPIFHSPVRSLATLSSKSSSRRASLVRPRAEKRRCAEVPLGTAENRHCFRLRLGEDLVPLAESDQHVQGRRHEAIRDCHVVLRNSGGMFFSILRAAAMAVW